MSGQHYPLISFSGSRGERNCPRPPYFNDSRILIVRHLPREFSPADVRHFLADAGAKEVKYFGNTGRLRNLAIAEFPNADMAVIVMQKLHQIRMGKRRLVVEFADDELRKHYDPYAGVASNDGGVSTDDGVIPKEVVQFFRQLNGVAPSCGVLFPSSHGLRYSYPPPSVTILTNIMYTMAKVTALYVQILHMMNKMNLPAPFGPLQDAPALFLPNDLITHSSAEAETATGEFVESDTESEIVDELVTVGQPTVSSVLKATTHRPRKKPKLSAFEESVIEKSLPTAHVSADLFDSANVRRKGPVRIERVSSQFLVDENGTYAAEETAVVGGFGVINSIARREASVEVLSEAFVTESELLEKRVTPEEAAVLPAFKNYAPGAPSSKLYIKNLAKTVEEEDLRFIFGRYVNWHSKPESESFSVRLMQEGRMKGQAFVGLPSQVKAETALKEVHGYILQGKPMVVSYSRSK